MYQRLLKMDLPPRQSAFLWGARKTGKSTYLKMSFPKAIYYDLLKSELYFQFLKEPHLFRQEVLSIESAEADPVIIVDEVQKIPALLDNIHWMIENTTAQFILCGSSARKLKKEGVNMLGGRAWRFHFFPLVYPELPKFDLLHILNHGTVPAHYDSKNITRAMTSYVDDYLSQEIQAESLVRNLPAFSRFLDALRFTTGEMVNYTTISRQAGVDAKTVREYFTILVDTLIGYFLYPYRKKVNRDIIKDTPKFYLFDVGLSTYLKRLNIKDLRGPDAGHALESYIYQELHAYRQCRELRVDITYWRTKSGHEVDFILGDGEVAVEVKVSQDIAPSDLKGIQAFMEEHPAARAIVVANVDRPRLMKVNQGDITILPIELFLQKLWGREIMG
ncbi:MAG: superfamily protein [Alphaproteobacteria bacterium]|jgi:predicted AAA+ superfamily ATPase|nr:superfamily protein [Alphaproteobacteria bacterium]MDF3034111.1 superfamily protein [Alphaproteobacteria bacterium]